MIRTQKFVEGPKPEMDIDKATTQVRSTDLRPIRSENWNLREVESCDRLIRLDGKECR